MTRPPLARGALLALVACLGLPLGACTVQTGSDDTAAASLVRDGTATLDLRTRPTREVLGLPGGRRSVAHESDDEPIEVTVLLPDGRSTRIQAYALSVDTVRGGDAPPSGVVVNARFASLGALSTRLWEQRDVLRLEEAPLVQTVGEAGTGSGSGEGVVPGLQEDFLTLDVDVRPSPSGTESSASYSFSFDLPPSGSPSAS